MCNVEKSEERLGICICVFWTRKIFTRMLVSGKHGGDASLTPPEKEEQSKEKTFKI